MQLTQSAVSRDQELAGLDEWAVLTVLAGAGAVPVVDTSRTEPVAPPRRRSVAGLVARDTGEFVGRRREQRRWPLELLAAAATGFVLHGIGGVGKTALASELVRLVCDREPDRVLVVPRGQLSVDDSFLRRAHPYAAPPPPPLGRAGTGAPRGGAGEPGGPALWAERVALLREDVLEAVPTLIVLDNFEDNLVPADGDWALRDEVIAEVLAAWVTDPGVAGCWSPRGIRSGCPTRPTGRCRFVRSARCPTSRRSSWRLARLLDHGYETDILPCSTYRADRPAPDDRGRRAPASRVQLRLTDATGTASWWPLSLACMSTMAES